MYHEIYDFDRKIRPFEKGLILFITYFFSTKTFFNLAKRGNPFSFSNLVSPWIKGNA